MNYSSNDPYITIGEDVKINYLDILNNIKLSNYDFILEIEAFRLSRHDVDVDKQLEYRKYNTKLVFSKLYNLDLILAEKEMSFSLGIEPFDEYEDETFYKIKEIIKSNTNSSIDELWLAMSIINHSNVEEAINRLPYIIEEINKDNMFKK